MPLWNSYISRVFPPSKSYGVGAHSCGTMKGSLHSSSRTREAARHQGSYPADSQATFGFPRPSEVLGEIGLLVVVHLAIALAVTLTLGAFGIA